MKTFNLLVLATFCLLLASAPPLKPDYPQHYFRSPLPESVNLLMAGTFAELRSNHFHGGLDLKTNGTTGMPIIAIADGYISRIKVATGGYGKVLYLTHPNGYTSVYAHLESFGSKIDRFTKAIQKDNESWEIEVYPGKRELMVNKGDTIAISGNTGASRAPHLHFEIRDTKTQTPIDPLLFGYQIEDNIRPRIYRFRLYPLSDTGHVKVTYTNNRSTIRKHDAITTRVSGSNGTYRLYPIKEIGSCGPIGFAINTYDYHDGSFNKLGVPLIEMQVNGKMHFKMELDKVPFSKTRYLNAHIDYEARLREGRYYNRLFVLPGNELDNYKGGDGAFVPELDSVYDVSFILSDRAGNQTILETKLRGIAPLPKPESSLSEGAADLFKYDQPNEFKANYMKAEFQEGSFYEDFKFQYDLGEISSKGYSHIHKVHNVYTPIQKYFTLSIKPINLPERYHDKAVIMRYNSSKGGFYRDGMMHTRVRYFGNFYIDIDSVPPSVRGYNIYNGKYMTRYSSLMLRMYDSKSGISKYKAYLDGKFVIFEYDYKRNMLTHRFEDKPDGKEHKLSLYVWDKVGNQEVQHFKFIR